MRIQLTREQVADIRAYCEAHHWRGSRAAIARKYGVHQYVITKILAGKTYKDCASGMVLRERRGRGADAPSR